MSNLIKCKTCNKVMMEEEIKSYIMCYIDQTKSKTIYASHVLTLKINEGQTDHMITGLDGITYKIIEKKPDFVPFDPSLTENTRYYTDKKNTHRLHRNLNLQIGNF